MDIALCKRRAADFFLRAHENPVLFYILLFAKPLVDMFYRVSVLDYLLLGYAFLLLALVLIRKPQNFRTLGLHDYLVLGIVFLLFLSFVREPLGFRIFVKTASMFLLFFIGRFASVNTEKMVRVLRLSFAIVVVANLFFCIAGSYGYLTSISFKEWGGAYTFCGLYFFKTDLAMAMLQAIVFLLATKRPRFYDYALAVGALWLTLLSNTRISFVIAFVLIGLSVLHHVERKVKRKFRIFDLRTIFVAGACAVLAVASLSVLGKSDLFQKLGFLGLDVEETAATVEVGADPIDGARQNEGIPVEFAGAPGDGTQILPEDNSLPGLLQKLLEKFYTPANTQGRSEIWRLVFEKFAAGSFLDRLFGYDLVSDEVYHQTNSNVSANAHNAYLKTLYSIGYLGVLLYACFFFLCLRRASRLKNRPVFFIGLSLVALLLVASLTNNSHEYTQLTWLPLFFIGLSFNPSVAEKEVCEVEEKSLFSPIHAPLTDFLHSPFYVPSLFILSILVVILEQQVIGTILFVFLICYLLEEQADITLTSAPFLFICVFDCMCYDSFNKFIGLWWMVFPALGALIYHFIKYRKPFTLGPSFRGLVAVSFAVTFGGLGFISLREYLNPIALYYTAGLGVGMIAVYLLLKTQLGDRVEEAQKARFLHILYAIGLLSVFCVLIQYVKSYEVVKETLQVLDNVISRNNFSTYLIFALPVPFYYARKNPLHLFTALLFILAILLSGSRGGLLAGAITLALCFVGLILCTEARRLRILYASLFGIFFAVALLLIPPIHSFFLSRLNPNGDLVDPYDTRMRFLRALPSNFKSNPLFGQGLGTEANLHIYTPKKGGLCWYHMMIPQIIGSLGIVGILGFGYQIIGRFRMLLRRLSPFVICLALMYIGIFVMSQMNPGELCPLPYEFLVVYLFVLVENEKERPFKDTLSKMWHIKKEAE